MGQQNSVSPIEKTKPAEIFVTSKGKANDNASAEEVTSNRWFRWNLVWFLLICLLLVPLPLWIYPISCVAGFSIICVVNAWGCLVLLVCMVNASRTMWKCYHPPPLNAVSDVTHLVVMCGYKEPIEVMMATLDSLKKQTAVKQLFVVVGLEEGTPEFDKKRGLLEKEYSNTFSHFMVTRHPRNIAGEIPGKCSNSNFASRQGVEKMKKLNLYDLRKCTATTCDTDNVFNERYFEYLGNDFLERLDRAMVVWQAPLFYNYQLDKRPFFVRVTGIIRSTFMMGMLIPQNINTMSVFSMSLELLEAGGYFHPGYQMDDIINKVSRMIATRRDVEIVLLPYPVISGPTSGNNFHEEVVEWARQARRWTIGAAEVFHYLCVKWTNFSGWTGLSYALVFTHYYGFVICAMSLMNFVGIIASVVYDAVDMCNPAEFLGHEHHALLPLIGVGLSYLIFAWMFVLDAFATRLLNVKEEIWFIRNAFHWLSTPFVLFAYSCIEFYAIVEVAIYGKNVCKHGASKKAGLLAV